MNLTERQRLWAAYAVREVIALRRIGGRPIPAAIANLDRSLRAGGSDAGTRCGRCESHWHADDLIGPEDAARILGCTARYVRRIASDLDGRLVGIMWVFDRQNVIAYAEAKGVASGGN